ncbi:MerR family transcriptional regulator [Actinospica durhamensis]|uniref:MerR family transcriptional regulator n=1 Tax=Actinospica durhamensis TaxID=1508375 RepID=A0A941EXZ8_9ACTN|nr:MerR family transcriptional regulator [Actinospica durhamensis]MBR7836029.1 MerR family transcriptional regulator [Actinospica durhamensis]
MSYSVGQVAASAGITVRTLHHYDEVGLLVPSGRSQAGHRRYGDEDLDRLQRILFYRELGFPLEEIAVLLDDPKVDPQEHLRRQHALLTSRIEKLQKMAAAVERATEARRMGINLTPEERFEVFGDFDPDEYADEARERWGQQDAYRESQRRTASYTKEDWLRIKQEQEDWGRRFAALMDSGDGPESGAAMELAEEHRQQICRLYYACTYEIHTGLAEMYLADPRFTSTFEAIKPGMAEYLSEAIVANAIHRA